MDNDQDQQLPIWPPAIVSNPVDVLPKNATRQTIRITPQGLLLGLCFGFVLSLVIGIGIMIVCMKIGGAMSMEGTPPGGRAATQQVAKIIEFLLLCLPALIFFFALRNKYHSFAFGGLVGSFLPNLCFAKLFFFS